MAKPGNTLQVRAVDFPANAVVDVLIAKQGQPFTGVVDGQVNHIGEVSAQVTVPAMARPGERWVVIVTTSERVQGTRAVSQPITITQ